MSARVLTGWLRRLAAAVVRRPTAAAALLMALGVLGLLWPVLIGQRALSSASLLYSIPPWTPQRPPDVAEYFNPVLSDVPTAYYPWWKYAREALRSGAVPEWNPYSLAGTPFYANAQSALLSPFNIPFWILPFHYAFGFAAALRLFVASLGAFLLARELRMGFAAAVVVGLAFGSSAFNIVWLSYPVLSVLALLPVALWLVERVVRRANARDALFLVAILLAALLGGHPGSQLHLYVIVGVYGLMRIALATGRRSRAAARGLLLLTAAMMLALGLAAVVLLPVALSIPGTVGAHLRSSLVVPDEAARTLFFPDWWGRPSDVDLGGPFNYNERTIYAGTVALLLAVLAIVSTRAWREKLPFVVLGFLGFQAAFGLEPTQSIVANVPVLSSDRNARLSILVQLGVAVLAGFAVDEVLQRPPRAWRLLVVGGTAAFVALAATAAIDPSLHHLRVVGNHFRTGNDYEIPDVVRLTAIVWWTLLGGALVAALLLLRRSSRGLLAVALTALVALDLAHFAWGYNPTPPAEHAFPAEPPSVSFLRSKAGTWRVTGIGVVLPPSTSLVYGLRDVRGNDPPMPEQEFMDVFRLVNPGQPEGDWLAIPGLTPTGHAILSMLSTRYVVLPPGSAPPAVRGLTLEYRGPDADVYRNDRAVPRASVPVVVAYAATHADAVARMGRPSFDPGFVAFVDRPGISAGSGRASIVRDQASEVVIRANLSESGLVVLADVLDEGWRVTVDGRRAEQVRVNAVLRGVEVPEGEHVVRWSYRTPGLLAGAAVSAAALATLVGWVAAAGGLPHRRRRRSEE